MKKYNWGIIGTGWIAHEMADALQASKGDVYAAANPNEDELKKFAAEKRVKHIFTNPEEMINNPNIQISKLFILLLHIHFTMTTSKKL